MHVCMHCGYVYMSEEAQEDLERTLASLELELGGVCHLTRLLGTELCTRNMCS